MRLAGPGDAWAWSAQCARRNGGTGTATVSLARGVSRERSARAGRSAGARAGGFRGGTALKERSTGVAFSGDLRVAYRACLESRIANRVFLELGRFDVADAEGFYRLSVESTGRRILRPGRRSLAISAGGIL